MAVVEQVYSMDRWLLYQSIQPHAGFVLSVFMAGAVNRRWHMRCVGPHIGPDLKFVRGN